MYEAKIKNQEKDFSSFSRTRNLKLTSQQEKTFSEIKYHVGTLKKFTVNYRPPAFTSLLF